MAWVDILGYVAATLTTLSFLPQVIKVWQTRSTKDLSLTTLIGLNLGIFLWLIYGLVIKAMPVIAANAVTLALTLTMLFFKQRYG
ncbi:MAG: SemiSWEET transporter [Pseudanabaenaceae cyanobacterium SKYGB_i_bin29]|nr:SemiSWEET transporter [Pseudanabaenaceae cyanobacterium SKYG29]MDW8421507.1 SemiSWEET transporter [Pseudanabaenaceae cyanobacterium SKYGB_i_bin29]